MTKKVFIMQSNYIPWKGYFDAINSVDKFVVYDSVQYTKNDWRNRNIIKTPHGTRWLTVPVKTNFGQRINETEVFNDKWSTKHLKTLKQNYSKSKYFKEISNLIFDLYEENQSKFLSDINIAFIKRINEYLHIDTEIIDDRSLELNGDKNDRLIQICEQLDCKHYYSAPAAKNYMDIERFDKNNIKVEFMDYKGYPMYKQLYGEFDHYVSILDLLFNQGPNSISLIKRSNKN